MSLEKLQSIVSSGDRRRRCPLPARDRHPLLYEHAVGYRHRAWIRFLLRHECVFRCFVAAKEHKRRVRLVTNTRWEECDRRESAHQALYNRLLGECAVAFLRASAGRCVTLDDFLATLPAESRPRRGNRGCVLRHTYTRPQRTSCDCSCATRRSTTAPGHTSLRCACEHPVHILRLLSHARSRGRGRACHGVGLGTVCASL